MRKNLKNYISNTNNDIYAIYNLPEEVISVLFAYYSRSSGSLKDNLQKLLNEDIEVGRINNKKLLLATQKAKEFHEKWTVGYGHSSVSEHSIIHMAVENVSMLAAKAIEDCRLASYTEKSTRYVVFDKTFAKPAEISNSKLNSKYINICNNLNDFYNKAFDQFYLLFKNEGMSENESKTKSCDICRNILPCSTYTNLGITANAREFQRIISKLLSNSSSEMNNIGDQILIEANKVCPTLLKHAEKNDYIINSKKEINNFKINNNNAIEGEIIVNLIKNSINLKEIAANILYEYSDADYNSILNNIKDDNIEKIILSSLKYKKEHDPAPRAFETIKFQHEIIMDFGSFRDIQRHRMTTQLTQVNEVWENSFIIQDEFNLFPILKAELEELMNKACCLSLEISDALSPEIAQYCLPMAFTKRVLFDWNLREIFHFVNLRSKKQGHKNYRKIAQLVWKTIEKENPFIASIIPVCFD